jgi:hypothetical protein
MKERSEAQKRADRKYKKEKAVRTYIEFYPTEAGLVEHLNKQDKKQTYIKNLIREDMKKEQP